MNVFNDFHSKVHHTFKEIKTVWENKKITLDIKDPRLKAVAAVALLVSVVAAFIIGYLATKGKSSKEENKENPLKEKHLGQVIVSELNLVRINENMNKLAIIPYQENPFVRKIEAKTELKTPLELDVVVINQNIKSIKIEIDVQEEKPLAIIPYQENPFVPKMEIKTEPKPQAVATENAPLENVVETAEVAKISEKELTAEEMAAADFQTFQELSRQINGELVKIYRTNPVAEAVINAAVVEIATICQETIKATLLEATKQGVNVSADVLFGALTSSLGQSVGEKSAKPIASFVLNRFLFDAAIGAVGMTVNEGLKAVNPVAAFGAPVALVKMLDLPLKLMLLDGIGKRVVEAQIQEKEQQLDGFFASILDNINLAQIIPHEEAGQVVQQEFKFVAVGFFGLLKDRVKAEAGKLMREQGAFVQTKLRETLKGGQYEKYLHMSMQIAELLYSGTEFKDSVLGQMTQNVILEPLAAVGKAAQVVVKPVEIVQGHLMGAALDMAKFAVVEGAYKVLDLTAQAAVGGAAAVDLVAGTVQAREVFFARMFVLNCYQGMVNAPRNFIQYAAKRKVEEPINALAEQMSHLVMETMIPKEEGVVVNYKALAADYQKPIDPAKRAQAEQRFLKEVETMAKSLAITGVDIIEKEATQMMHRHILKFRNFFYRAAGVAITDENNIENTKELQAVLQATPENLNMALDAIQEMLITDVSRLTGEAVENVKSNYLKPNEEDYKIARLAKWAFGYAADAAQIAASVAIGYYFDTTVKQPCLKARDEAERELHNFIHYTTNFLRSENPTTDEGQEMSFEEATKIFCQIRTKNLIRSGQATLLLT